MGAGHGVDDREAEAEGAAAVAGAADEPLEQRRGEVGRHARPVVGDDQLDAAVGQRASADLHFRAGRGMAEGVLDQVDRQPVQLIAGPEHLRRLHIEGDLVIAAHGPQLGGGLDDDLGHVERLAGLLAGGVGASQQQQVGDQPAHALR